MRLDRTRQGSQSTRRSERNSVTLAIDGADRKTCHNYLLAIPLDYNMPARNLSRGAGRLFRSACMNVIGHFQVYVVEYARKVRSLKK